MVKEELQFLAICLNFGEFSEKLHRDVGLEVYKNNIDMLFTIGKYAKYIAEEAEKLGFNKENVFIFDDKTLLLQKLKENLQDGDVVLFKASNGMHLFEVVEQLQTIEET